MAKSHVSSQFSCEIIKAKFPKFLFRFRPDGDDDEVVIHTPDKDQAAGGSKPGYKPKREITKEQSDQLQREYNIALERRNKELARVDEL